MSSRAQFKQHYNRGSKLAAKRQFEAAILEFEKALSIKQNDVETIFQLGNMAREMRLYEVSVKWYEIALRLQPNQLEILFNRALALKLLGRNEDALIAFEIIAPRMEGSDIFWNNYGNLLMQMARNDEAIRCFEKALSLKPKDARYWNNLGMAMTNATRWEEALNAFEKAEKGLGKLPDYHINVANVYFRLGQLEDAWRHYQWRHNAGHVNAIEYLNDFPRWTGEDLTGKTIILSAEQGLGDQLAFATCLPEIIEKAGRVILEIGSKLVPIFSRCYPDICVRGPSSTQKDLRIFYHYDWVEQEKVGPIDFFAPLGDALCALRPDFKSFPFDAQIISAHPVYSEKVRELLEAKRENDGPFVGLSWGSGLVTGARQGAYQPLERVKQAIEETQATINFVNLQYGITDDERAFLSDVKSPFGSCFFDLEEIDQYNDLEGVVALIDNLDLVVSVRNCQLSLTGAMGHKGLALGESQLKFGWHSWDPLHPSIAYAPPVDWYKSIPYALVDYNLHYSRMAKQFGEAEKLSELGNPYMVDYHGNPYEELEFKKAYWALNKS